MEKSHTEILISVKEEIEDLKARLSALEERLSLLESAELQSDAPEEETEPQVEEPAAPVAEAEEPEAVDMEVITDGPDDLPPMPETVAEGPADGAVDFSEIELGEAEELPPSAHAQAEVKLAHPVAKAPAADDPTANLPWRKDRPGLPVKNIRSGISLLDRALFIGTLFGEDADLYDATLQELNNMQTLDQAISYVRTHFPDWKMDSSPVYHFMMSVRKKLG